MAEECIICGCSGSKLAQCKGVSSWTTLHRTAVIRNHKPILEASTKSEFPESTIKYHRNCRAEFTNKRNLQTNNKPSDDAATGTSPRRNHRDGYQPNSAILPDQHLFCKSKYKPNTKTREKLHSVQEFRADETVRACASLHVKQNTEMSEVARDVIGICAEDPISSVAKYHDSCYKSFVKTFESSTHSFPAVNLEQLKLDPNQEDFERVINNCEFRGFGDQFHVYVQGMREKGSLLGRFWLSYLELCELMLNLIYASRTGSWELYFSCIEEVVPWAFAYDRQYYARYLIPFLDDTRHLLVRMPEVSTAFNKGHFSVQMGSVTFSDKTKLTKPLRTLLIATAKREKVTSGLVLILPRLRDGCSMTQGVVCTGSFFVSICLLLHPNQTYVHKELAPACIKEDLKALGKLVDVLENVFTNPWKKYAAFTSLSTGIVATTEISDDLLEAKSKRKQAANDFVVSRFSSHPTLDYFDTLKKAKLKSFKDLKAVCKVRNKDLVLPIRMDRDVFARMALLGQFRQIDMKVVSPTHLVLFLSLLLILMDYRERQAKLNSPNS